MATVDLGKGYVQIVPSAKNIKNSISNELNPAATKAGLQSGQRIATGIGQKLKTVGGGMMKAGAIATAISVPIIAGIKKSLGAYEIQNAAETKLIEIYKTRMGASKDAAQATMELASALQKEGIIGDEVQLSGAQQLATFAKMPGTVNTLLPAMNNLLAQQKGYNATAQDATGIANLMGKVMNGQVGALKRVGISFDENQEKMLKTGTEEEKAAVLAQVITDNVGNMNAKMAETPLGKIQQMKNTWGDLTEQTGGMFAPVLADVAKMLSSSVLPVVERLIKTISANPIIAKIVVGLAGLLAIGGPILIIVGALVSAIGTITTALAGLTAAMLAPVAIGALIVGGIIAIVAASSSLRSTLADLGKSLLPPLISIGKSLWGVIKVLVGEVISIAATLGNSLAPVIKQIAPFIIARVTLIAAVVKQLAPFVIAIIRVISAAIKAAVVVIAGTISAVITIIGNIPKYVSSAVKGATKAWNSFVKGTKAAFNKVKATIQVMASIGSTLIKLAGNMVKGAVSKFQSMVGKVKSTFNSIKNAATAPFKSMISVISSAVAKVKSFFPINLGSIVSKLRIPQLKVSGGKAPWGLGGQGSMPRIYWAAKGAIVDGATLVGLGAGEKGAEAIVPLDPFWKKLEEMNTQPETTYNISVNVDAQDLDGVMSVKEFLRMLQRAKQFA